MELGHVPILILGDFNVNPDKSATIQNAMATRGWHDVAVRFADVTGGAAQATCFKSPAGTRIDAVICNTCATMVVRDFKVIEDSGLPTQKPIQVSLDV